MIAYTRYFAPLLRLLYCVQGSFFPLLPLGIDIVRV